MRTITCRSLGQDCNWKQTAGTDDLLLDKVAVHLREAHGIPAIYPEMMGAIHRAFSGPENDKIVTPGDVDPELKEFRCADIGQRCDFHYIAMTEELIADGAAVHAREAHGIMEFTPEMIAQVKKSVHVWNA